MHHLQYCGLQTNPGLFDVEEYFLMKDSMSGHTFLEIIEIAIKVKKKKKKMMARILVVRLLVLTKAYLIPDYQKS